jgi:HD-like signal output (HDOD) protein
LDSNERSYLLDKLASGYALPPLSPVALRLVELASEESCSAQDLVVLIEKDPSLAVRLLKLANSAFFRTTYPVGTLNQAVVKIGLQRMRIMALSISLRDAFPIGKRGAFDYDAFWRISLYRGLIAKGTAAHLGTCQPDEAFTGALIREIGLLIFIDLFLKDKPDLSPPSLLAQDALLSWERTSFGITHREIGETALRHWRFPEEIIACQMGQVAPTQTEPVAPLVQICDVAGALSESLFGESTDFHEAHQKAHGLLGLAQDVVSTILAEAFVQVQETADGLDLAIDKEQDLVGVMEKANIALSRISEKVYQGPLASFSSLDRDDSRVKDTLQAVAHEIRNPLMAVGGFARKLATSLDPASETGKYVAIILAEALRLEKALAEMAARTSS